MNDKQTQKQIIHVFDVDGTITEKDSFMELLRYFIPSKIDWFHTWLRAIPALVQGFLKGNLSIAKLHLLKSRWLGKKQIDIYRDCSFFFNDRMKYNIKPKALEHIKTLKKNKPEEGILLLSASCREWLKHLATFLEADLICTELDYNKKTIFTGQFATPNCKGKEKLKRLLEKYPTDKFEFICYGNSPADKELQSISKEFYYRYF
jgi:phosphatidylglycerophosphatase C